MWINMWSDAIVSSSVEDVALLESNIHVIFMSSMLQSGIHASLLRTIMRILTCRHLTLKTVSQSTFITFYHRGIAHHFFLDLCLWHKDLLSKPFCTVLRYGCMWKVTWLRLHVSPTILFLWFTKSGWHFRELQPYQQCVHKDRQVMWTVIIGMLDEFFFFSLQGG